jgi:hypothetical protein
MKPITITGTPLTLESFVRTFGEVLPVRAGNVELSGATHRTPIEQYFFEREGVLVASIWLVIYEDDGQIRDIKEQEIPMVFDVGGCSVERLAAMLEGFGRALALRVRADRDSSWYDCAMPSDLLNGSALRLVKPQTADDFEDVFCRRWKIGPHAHLRAKPKRAKPGTGRRRA